MNWKGFGRKQAQSNLVYYPNIYMEELRKTMKNLRMTGLWAENFSLIN
jgi:hypothetical protein